MLCLRVLGPLSVAGERRLPQLTLKTRALLGYLACHAGAAVTRRMLADLL